METHLNDKLNQSSSKLAAASHTIKNPAEQHKLLSELTADFSIVCDSIKVKRLRLEILNREYKALVRDQESPDEDKEVFIVYEKLHVNK